MELKITEISRKVSTFYQLVLKSGRPGNLNTWYISDVPPVITSWSLDSTLFSDLYIKDFCRGWFIDVKSILWRVALRWWWWNIFQGSCVGIEAFVGSLCQFTIICSWENRGRRNHRCANGTPAWEVKVKYRVARKFAQFPGVFEKILTARKFSDFGEIEMAWKFAQFCEKTKATRKFAQISEIFRENWGPTMWSKFSRTGGRLWLTSLRKPTICVWKLSSSIQTCPPTRHSQHSQNRY